MDEPVLGTTLLVLPLAAFTDDAVLLYNVVRLLTFLFSALTAYWLARELGVGRGDRAPGGRALRVLADPDRPGRAPLDAGDAVVAAGAAVHDPLRAQGPDAGRAARRALLRARLPGLRLPRGDRGRRCCRPRCWCSFWRRWDRLKAGRAGGGRWPALALLPALPHAPEGARARALRARERRRRSSTRPRSSPSSRRAPGTGSTARRPTPSAPSGRTTCSRVWSCPASRWPGRSSPAAEAGAAEPGGGGARACCSLAAALVALGPRVRAFGHDLGPGPWALLRDAVPLFQMIRVTSRAGVFVALPLAMLAAHGARPAASRGPGRSRSRRPRWRSPRR